MRATPIDDSSNRSPRLLRFLRLLRLQGAVAALALTLVPGVASANDSPDLLGIQVRSPVQVGGDSPAIIINPSVTVKKLTIKLAPKEGSGRGVTLRASNIKRGQQKILAFKQGTGTSSWVAQVEVRYGTGESGRFQIELETTVYPKLALELARKDVDLTARRVTVRINQPAARVELIVTGDDGKVMHQETTEFIDEAPGADLTVGWEQSPGVAVLKMDVKAWSTTGFWVGAEITPFEVDIPHEDVEFDSGKWDVRPGEEPKLQHTLELLAEKLKRYGGLVKLQLYIAGYTDTVGSRSSNAELSEKRARAIGQWFKRKGIPIPIYYQGFGEDVLAVKTPDETAEQKNRRALYVLSAHPPSSQPAMPRSAWKKL